ncbi:hypothetical protein [Carboxylicivirga sp. M1479]|uniref:hypothetical protein n=1 Tax=Carboxylicivirga sp. M1479 TaxID=2594476 RepID=UPI0011778B16|nr:hypothetical protein [Carboxylicivirga sp. M1479]TRX70820.1 hypothetical protein FNN09_10040 [Carboxylicivirga sp. M1479]
MTEIVLNSSYLAPQQDSNRKQFLSVISNLFFGSQAEAHLGNSLLSILTTSPLRGTPPWQEGEG